MTQTQKAAAGQTVLDTDSKGNRYLPGSEEVVDKELAKAAGAYHALKTERVELSAKEVAAKKTLAFVCHQKKDLFSADPNNSNAKIYRVGDLIVRLADEEVVTTEIPKAKKAKKEKD